MSGTNVRKLSGLARDDRIAALRSRMAELEGADRVAADDVLSVGEMSRIMPGGGLLRRAVTECSDSPALVVELISHVTAAGGHVAVLGWPELSVAEVENLEHIVVVPDPGPDPLGIASVLVEGLDLMVWYSRAPLTLSPVRSRPLLARLRTGRASLLLVGVRTQSPAVRLDARVTTYRGIGAGTGRIRGLDLQVRAEAKNHRASMTLTLGKKPWLRAI